MLSFNYRTLKAAKPRVALRVSKKKGQKAEDKQNGREQI